MPLPGAGHYMRSLSQVKLSSADIKDGKFMVRLIVDRANGVKQRTGYFSELKTKLLLPGTAHAQTACPNNINYGKPVTLRNDLT